MELGLKGKRIIVTGGTRGIGAAIVDGFLAEGASVAFCARKKAEVDERVAALEAQGHTVVGTVCDVTDAGAYANWIETSVTALGGLDVFVPNVSGGAKPGEEGWKAAFDIDLMATVRGCEAVIPHLAATGGNIVVIASIAGLEAIGAGPSPYNTAKAGLVAYASQLGDIAMPHGVRVNTVSPGPIHVEDGFWGDVERNQADMYKMVSDRHGAGRLGTAQEVANCVVFLASSAASWVTRSNLVIDGGFCKRVQY